jgi:NAD(P)-dependent dehydrogenase (short-subunit alcohol dehydrogenase family)
MGGSGRPPNLPAGDLPRGAPRPGRDARRPPDPAMGVDTGGAQGRLAGRRAVVTGAGAGIGRGIARLFAREGAAVAVIDRDAARATRTRDEIREAGGTVVALTADVSRGDAVDSVFSAVGAEWGGLDVLVNNAGIARRRSLERLPLAQWEAVMATNLTAVLLCTQAALPLLRRGASPKIVNIASIAAFRHSRRLGAYSASKGGVISLSRHLALELARDGIHVNYICPGLIRTEMVEPVIGRWLLRRYVERRTPLGRLGTPDDVARVAVFLASPDSDFVTGQGITVDGGLTLPAY